MRTAVGVRLQSGYALPSPQTHSGVSSRLTGNLILIVAQQKDVHAMVVDDLPDVALVLASMLESAGAEVFCETDPDFLKDVLAEAPGYWSVLVTDLHMPRTDGAALARFAASLTPPVPVVLVTARPDTLDDRNLKDFAAILSKPVSGAQLVHAVRQAVDAQNAAQSQS